MKILVIGHSIIDHFEGKAGGFSQPGGIFYTVTGMLSVCSNSKDICLITSYTEDNFHLFAKAYQNVDMSYSYETSNMPEVVLSIYENEERGEVYKNISSNLALSKLGYWNVFSGILINMITGFDISVEQLQFIRKSFNGPIYLDIHTLARGIDENMKREFRQIPEINSWLKNVDIIQCNEMELRTIFNLGNETLIVEKILASGPKIIIITKGGKGLTAYSNTERKIEKYDIPAETINEINKVGCGDIFGAVFFYSYLSGKNIHSSLILANKSASIAVSNKILENPEVLKIYDWK